MDDAKRQHGVAAPDRRRRDVMAVLDPPITDSQRSTDPADGIAALPQLAGQLTRTEQVLNTLKEAILEGGLVRGSLRSVGSLASQLGVSRTPVREALLQLARQDMVSFERGRGVRIMETSAHDVKEIFQIRQWLEPPATRLAVPNLDRAAKEQLRYHYMSMREAAAASDDRRLWRHDRAFHLLILQGSGNSRLANHVDGLRELTLLRRAVSALLLAQGMAEIAEHHRPILDAIEIGHAAQAAKAMQWHIQQAGNMVVGHTAMHPRSRSVK